jgi:coenzyme F420-0:L-glutamate ligase/coenzyme F420-1:gamma-L-glutamate ligase
VRLGPGDLFATGTRDLVGSRGPTPLLTRRPGAGDAVTGAFRVAVAALPEFPVVFRYGLADDGDDGDVVDVRQAEPVTPGAALSVGAVVGAALVQLQAEGWATRWQPVATLGGSSLVGRLRLGAPPP